METWTIQYKEVPKGGVFEAFLNDEKAGEVTFAVAPEGYIVIDHTIVFEAFNGKGIGKGLVTAAVDWAVEHAFKIKPVCPYAVKLFDQTEAWQDLRL